ncbi:hypothetical protein D3C77_447690 [compost metagenome]
MSLDFKKIPSAIPIEAATDEPAKGAIRSPPAARLLIITGTTAQCKPSNTTKDQVPPRIIPAIIAFALIRKLTAVPIHSPTYTPKGPIIIAVSGTIIISEKNGTANNWNVFPI